MRHFLLFLCLYVTSVSAQLTPFERSAGKETATYYEARDWYLSLAKKFRNMQVKTMGMTDAGEPLHLVTISKDLDFNPQSWRKKGKLIILVNNGIHPGEPDGIDASMMLARDILQGKVNLPSNVVISFIPVYNIGGALNRNSYTRANQNGPVAYGFRGNSQNLDLNRDFTKTDSREALAFTEIFQLLQPDILIDNHVSDGADFQHTMTLISTQYDKLGEPLGTALREKFEPALYNSMKQKKWEMIPYVDFEDTDPTKGMRMFYDPPRYSSGYAALFQTMSFMPETHMLKAFDQRVRATYDLMISFIQAFPPYTSEIHRLRTETRQRIMNMASFPVRWKSDSSRYQSILFKGYARDTAISQASGLPQMFYNHARPFANTIPYYYGFSPSDSAQVPSYYVIPQGWWEVTRRLRANGVRVISLPKDSSFRVQISKIQSAGSFTNPYEKHFKHTNVKYTISDSTVHFRKGDILIPVRQPAMAYIMQMLELKSDDSFFTWNFFDGILQAKEGYSDYRWDQVAAGLLAQDTGLQHKLAEAKSKDPQFAGNAAAILRFIYMNSPYAEKSYMAYPVYKLF